MKTKAAEEIGIIIKHVKLYRSTTQDELLATINGLNNDINVHAILLQLPLDSDNDIGM